MPGKIVVIGSANVDFTMKMGHLPRLGESVPDAKFKQTFGGKGANQAVAVSLAGGEAQFVGCVGDDVFGGQMIANLQHAGVRTEYVSIEAGVPSGAAQVMVDAAGGNYQSVAPGANHRLGRARLDQLRGLISQAEMVMLQYEIPPETLAYAIELASSFGVPVMLNLAPAGPIAAQALRKVSYLVVNELEAEFLCGFQIAPGETANRAGQVLRWLGPPVVVITLGAAGAVVAFGDQVQAVPAFSVQAVDTNAAGDVFCGALAVALVDGKVLPEAVSFANAAAAIAVTRLGGQPSIPTRKEIDAFLKTRSAL